MLFEPLVLFDVLCCTYQDETWVITAMIAGRKLLPVNTCYFVLLCVIVVVGHTIDAGPLNLVARFVL